MWCWDSLASRFLGPLLLKSCRVWGWFLPNTFQGLHFLFSGSLSWRIAIWTICPWNKFKEKAQCDLAMVIWIVSIEKTFYLTRTTVKAQRIKMPYIEKSLAATSNRFWPYCALDAWPTNETYCLTRASSSFMQIWFLDTI